MVFVLAASDFLIIFQIRIACNLSISGVYGKVKKLIKLINHDVWICVLLGFTVWLFFTLGGRNLKLHSVLCSESYLTCV